MNDDRGHELEATSAASASARERAVQLSLQAAASDEDAAVAQPCTGTDGGAVSASTGVSLQTAAELLAQVVPVEDAGGNRPGSGRLCLPPDACCCWDIRRGVIIFVVIIVLVQLLAGFTGGIFPFEGQRHPPPPPPPHRVLHACMPLALCYYYHSTTVEQ